MRIRAGRPRALRVAVSALQAAVTAFAVLVATAMPARATGPTVTGAGSTWVQIGLDQWRSDIAKQGLSINYQGIGSSAGRQFYIGNQVDFAASEIPFQPDELPQLRRSYQYLPDVAGGTSLMYNLHDPSGSRITNLRLDANTAAKIFTGALSSWQDSAIQALNPGMQIRETALIPVIRSDGSGTSAQFSLYLADQAAGTWNAFVGQNGCPAPCSVWPTFQGSTQQKGSDGVANFVSNDQIGGGSIGYVEAGYAFGRNFPVASLKNSSGNFAQPTADNVAIALRHATLNPDLTQNLTGTYRSPEANAYPMSSYSYMITPTTGFDPAKGAVLGAWILYIACAGQREAAPLGYSPLPPNLVQADFNAVQHIPGAPAPPPLDSAHCANPTLSGSNGGPAVGSGSSGGSGGGGTGPAGAGGGGGGGGAGGGTAGATGGHGGTGAGAGPGGGAAAAGHGGVAGGAGAPADAAAAASASAAADATAIAGADTSTPSAAAARAAAGVDILSAAQRNALFGQAVRTANDARGVPPWPLIVAALAILLGAFGPLAADRLGIRRRTR